MTLESVSPKQNFEESQMGRAGLESCIDDEGGEDVRHERVGHIGIPTEFFRLKQTCAINKSRKWQA